MEPMSLFEQNVLVLDQVRNLTGGDCTILNVDGSPAATIRLEDSAVSRLFRGSRDMTITENGRPVLQITDGRVVTDAAGTELAVLTSHNGLFTTKITVQMGDGAIFECEGPLAGQDFTVTMGERVAARIAGQMQGVPLQPDGSRTLRAQPGSGPPPGLPGCDDRRRRGHRHPPRQAALPPQPHSLIEG